MIRELRTTILASCVLLCISFCASATTVYTVTLTKSSAKSTATPTPIYPEDALTKGHRTPPTVIVCTISDTDGLYISTVTNEDIYMFEIYDVNNNCIASFPYETDFISVLFTLSGTYEIRLYTEDFTYIGYLNI